MSDSKSTIPAGFRQIPGFSRYCIAEDGTVLSVCNYNGGKTQLPWSQARRIAPATDSTGYHRVSLCSTSGQVCQKHVHTLVLETFVGLRPDTHECRHLDGKPTNNHVSNLAWGTHSANMRDKVLHGTALLGERNPNATLNADDVLEIRRRAAHGELHRVLAGEFHILRSSVSNIVRRVSWKHIE